MILTLNEMHDGWLLEFMRTHFDKMDFDWILMEKYGGITVSNCFVLGAILMEFLTGLDE